MVVRAPRQGGTIGLDGLANGLLPATVGHVARGYRAPAVPAHAIEAFPDRVAAALAGSRATGLEHGFLAYAPEAAGAPFVAEEDSVGSPDEIAWHWHARDATVAFSFHTHPGPRALCVPSGMDLVGALVRGDGVLYVLTMDGRLTGWRFTHPARHPRAVEDAMRALEKARALRRPLVDFLYDAFDAMRSRLVTCEYAARVTLAPADDPRGGCTIERARPDAPFFLPEEDTHAPGASRA